MHGELNSHRVWSRAIVFLPLIVFSVWLGNVQKRTGRALLSGGGGGMGMESVCNCSATIGCTTAGAHLPIMVLISLTLPGDEASCDGQRQ